MAGDVVGRMAVELVADATKLSRDMVRQSSSAGEESARGFGSAFSAGIGKVAAAAGGLLAAAQVGAFVQDSVRAASDLGESFNAVEKTFTTASGKITAFGETAAQSVGLSQSAFQGLATSTGSLLTNFGYSADDAADSTINLTTRAADMASVFNTDVETALGAINAGLRGETEPLRAFGVNLNDAALKGKAMELGLYDGKGALDDHAKAAAAQALILEQTEKVSGDFADTADSLANRQRTVAAEMENAKAAFGEIFLPVAEAVAGFVSDTLIPAFEGFTDWISTDLGPKLAEAKGWWEEHQEKFAAVAGVITTIFLPALALMGWQALINAGKVVVGWVMQSAGAATSLAAQLITFAVLGWHYVILGIKAVVGAGRVVVGWVMQSTAAVASKAVQAAVFLWQGIQWALAGAKAVIGAAIQVGAWVATGVAAMVNAVIIAAAWLIAMGPVGWVIAAVIAVIGIFALLWVKFEGFRNFWKAAWAAIKDAFSAAWQGIKDGLAAAVGWIRGKWDELKNLFSSLKDTLSNLKNDLIGKAKDLVRGIWEGIKSMGSWIKDKITGWARDMIPGPIAKVLGIASPSRLMAEYGRDVAAGLAVGMDDGGGMVASAADAMAARVASPMGGGWRPGPVEGAGATVVKVFIGDQELRGMIRTEVGEERRGGLLLAGMGRGD